MCFVDKSLYTVQIQRQESMDSQSPHFCPSSCVPLRFAAAQRSDRCELKINLHPRCLQYDTIECSGRMRRVNLQRCVGYRVCFGTRGIVLYNSCAIEIVQAAGIMFNCWWFVQYGRKKESRYWREEGINILEFLRFGSHPEFW